MRLFRLVFIFFVLFLITACELFYPPNFEKIYNNSTNQKPNNSLDRNGIFVSASGQDTNSGTETNSPMQSLQAAYINALFLGKRNIYVMQGNYTPGAGLTVGGPGLTISNNDINLSGGWNSDFSLQNGLSTMDETAQIYNVLLITNCQNIKVQGFIIKSATASGLYFDNVHNSLFSNINIINNANSSGNGGGIFAQNSGNCKFDVVLSNNTCSGTGGGIELYNCSQMTIKMV